jgi:diguanylate cyclase (GGDEF)-like protein
VLVMDLNGFKQVNDTLGHAGGDSVLREVASRLAGALREADTVARLGGDEFGILLDGATDLEAAATAAWKIEQACEPEFVIDDEVVRVSTSIGIALYPEHGTTTADLLHRADLAMYDAKRSGASHAVFDAAHEQQLALSLALLADLRECVAREELVVHYQPLIDLATRMTTGVEALVRWRHPTQGLLQPGSFLPQAERTAMIAPLTRWVLNEAMRQQRIWLAEGVDLTMAINSSALRRASPEPEESVIAVAGLEIDRAAHVVRRDGVEVYLTPTEFELLLVLVSNRGRLLTHRALLIEVWGPGYADDTQVLRTHIARLRHKIEPADGIGRRYIRTEPGVGFRF